MRGTNTGRLRHWARHVGVGLLGVAIAACAASTQMSSDAVGGGAIAEVRVESASDATMVTLVGLAEPVFTAFAQQNPEKVIVDLASASAENVDPFLMVGDGVVHAVRVSPFSTGNGEPMVRVEVELSTPSDYQVIPSP